MVDSNCFENSRNEIEIADAQDGKTKINQRVKTWITHRFDDHQRDYYTEERGAQRVSNDFKRAFHSDALCLHQQISILTGPIAITRAYLSTLT